MKQDKKKTIAAVAAVYEYLKTEQEAAAIQAAGPAPDQAQPAAAPVRLWGVSGRQAQMQFRNLMQLKAMHGWKMR